MITKGPQQNMGEVFLGRVQSVCVIGVKALGTDEVTVNSVPITFPNLAKSRSYFSAKVASIMIIVDWFPGFATGN